MVTTEYRPKVYCVDFDGTVLTHEYPLMGSPVPGAIHTLLEMQERGDFIILYTMRSDKELKEAVAYMERCGIRLLGVNRNPTQNQWTTSEKIYAHKYIDDNNVGTPLVIPIEGRPYVDWYAIRDELSLPPIVRVVESEANNSG